jgi:hypothetical protein
MSGTAAVANAREGQVSLCSDNRLARISVPHPLAILEGFRLYELLKYVSMTNHMWSGYNLMAHLATWRRLPRHIQSVIEHVWMRRYRDL